MIFVSDHALIRFMERAGGLDLAALRSHITVSLARAVEAAAQIGVADYTIRANGLTYVVRNHVVVTIMDHRATARGGGDHDQA